MQLSKKKSLKSENTLRSKFRRLIVISRKRKQHFSLLALHGKLMRVVRLELAGYHNWSNVQTHSQDL